VVTDNAFADRRSTAFKTAVAAIGAQQRFIKPHCPWTNGKVERRVSTSNTRRANAPPRWLKEYNNTGQPTISRLSPTS
jgi:transposase InsO family protein